MVFGSIVQIENQGRDARELISLLLPPPTEQIYQTVTGDFRDHSIHAQVIVFGQQEPDGSDLSIGMEIMVGGMDLHPVLALA
jgi:hypothetical protein